METNPLHHARYQRSNTYDPQWVLDNQMGPNALWLALPFADGFFDVVVSIDAYGPLHRLSGRLRSQ